MVEGRTGSAIPVVVASPAVLARPVVAAVSAVAEGLICSAIPAIHARPAVFAPRVVAAVRRAAADFAGSERRAAAAVHDVAHAASSGRQ